MVLTTAQGRGGIFHQRWDSGFVGNSRFGVFSSGGFVWDVLGGEVSGWWGRNVYGYVECGCRE
jgi:hypothetical protein